MFHERSIFRELKTNSRFSWHGLFSVNMNYTSKYNNIKSHLKCNKRGKFRFPLLVLIMAAALSPVQAKKESTVDTIKTQLDTKGKAGSGYKKSTQEDQQKVTEGGSEWENVLGAAKKKGTQRKPGQSRKTYNLWKSKTIETIETTDKKKWQKINSADGKKTFSAGDKPGSNEKKDYDPNKLSLPLKASEWKNLSTGKKSSTDNNLQNNSLPEQSWVKVDKKITPAPAKAKDGGWTRITSDPPPVTSNKQPGGGSQGPSSKIKELEARILQLEAENQAARRMGTTGKALPPPAYIQNRVAFRSPESINKSISPVLGLIMQEYYNRNQNDESLAGNVVLSFKIKNTGELFWLKVSYSTVENKNFLNFVMKEFKNCSFEPVDPKSKPISMIYPMVFKPLDDL